MQLNEILAMSADQERGAWFDLVDPLEGRPTGIRLRIAGPDSDTQRRARLMLADELVEMADVDGRVSSEHREKARIANLARCVLGWECEEDGKAVPFTTLNIIRLIRAGTWVEAQVDAFAADRAAHRGVS